MKRSDQRTVAGRILDKRQEQPSWASRELQFELRQEERGRWGRLLLAAAVFSVMILVPVMLGLAIVE